MIELAGYLDSWIPDLDKTPGDSLEPHTRFMAELYVLLEGEDGRNAPLEKSLRPQFEIQGTGAKGTMTFPEETDKVYPGENVYVEIALEKAVAIEQRLRFTFADGGKTIGVGVVGVILGYRRQ